MSDLNIYHICIRRNSIFMFRTVHFNDDITMTFR